MTSSAKREWLVPAGLIMLSVVPVIAGAARAAELTGGATVTPDNAPARACTACSGRSSSPPACAAADPAGTASPDDC